MPSQRDSDVILETDVLVVGGGIAGLFAAIKAREAYPRLSVLLVDKAFPGASGSSVFAAGTLPYWQPGEDYDNYIREIIEYNAEYLIDQEYVEVAVRESYERFQDLLSFGVRFLRADDGKIKRIPALCSQYGRCAIFDGGPNLMWRVRAAAKKHEVHMLDRIVITDLMVEDGRCLGAVGFHARTATFHVFKAKATVLAAGSIFFNRGPMGSSGGTGDGPAMAYRAGVELRNLEQIGHAQVGPKGFGGAPGLHVIFGHGGVLVNARGERFMERYNPVLKEESRRSEIARAILMEWRAGRGPCYLDCTHLSSQAIADIKHALPLLTRMWATTGVDIARHRLEFIPYQFGLFHLGGARIRNADGEVNLAGLWVIGTNGDFCGGADSTAVTSLIGSSVQGARAGTRAAGFATDTPPHDVDEALVRHLREDALSPLHRRTSAQPDPDRVMQRVLETSLRHINILKSAAGLNTALSHLGELEQSVREAAATDAHQLKKVHDIKNMLQIARLCAATSLLRTESRQSHYRLDYPRRDDANWLKWIIVRRDGDEPRIWTEDIPLARWKHRPQKSVAIVDAT
ncbi:MAG: FAD-binding protein [Chloroflexi bacterium]|nr:FAD-binding protein [Chloroflexota bacterium]